MSTLTIYRSSAGSGKTHTLVSAYLQLALASPMRFQEILAVTFTNQATKEMKQRILGYLHSLTQNIDTPIANELSQVLGYNKEVLQQKAKILLSNILHHYDRFTVSTIDSFFQTILRSFAQELGIPPNFKVELDQWSIIDQLIDEVIDSASQDPALQQWLVTLAEHKLLKGKNWHFKRELYSLGLELFKEAFSLQEADFIQATQDKDRLHHFLTTLEQTILHFETTLQELGKSALEAIQQSNLHITDFAYASKGVAGYLASLYHKKSFTPTQRAIHALEDITVWYSKMSTNKPAIIQVVQESLQDILKQAVRFYQTHYQHYYTALAIQQFIYALGIITHLKEKLQDYRAQHHVMLISDITHLLRQIIAENETPFIYEKIGTYYKHFLIDEFQDISGFQWQNLQPLIHNSLASGHKSLLVGDIKQSIYRWRGGNWRLLLKELTTNRFPTNTISLHHNWRSKKHIVDFNNTFFTDASWIVTQHLQTEIAVLEDTILKKALAEQLQEITAAYQDVCQHIPDACLQEGAGYVQINLLKEEVLETGEKLSWQQQAKQRLPTLIETLQEDGYRLQDIAVLVRNNAEGRDVFQTLLSYQQSSQAKPGYQYNAISAESLYLGHNPWINILINALKYLAHEEDKLAETELVCLYQKYVLKNHAPILYLNRSSSIAQKNNTIQDVLPDSFIMQRTQLQMLPLYERIAALVPIFQLQSPDITPFIQAFLDAVLQYLQTEPAEWSHFINWWTHQGSQLSLPHMPGQHAISIMTIHQAKGLQFKVVIIPFCDWDLDHSPHNPPIMWCNNAVEPFSQWPILPIRYGKNLQDTLYALSYHEEKMQIYLDNLNLLYVAFTRPEDRLYIFAPQPNKPALKSIADLLLHTFTKKEQLPQKSNNQLDWYSYWDSTTHSLIVGTPNPKQTIHTGVVTNYAAPFLFNPWHINLNTTLRPILPNDQIQPTNMQAMQTERIANLLIKLPTLTQLPGKLKALQLEKGMSSAEITSLESDINCLFQQPFIKSWYEGTWKWEPYTSLLGPGGQLYQPDRFMIQENQALLVNFLSNAADYDQVYQQVKETADLLISMQQYASVEAYLLEITTQTLHKVHTTFLKIS